MRALLALLLLTGCNETINGHWPKNGPGKQFGFVVANDDVAYAETMTVTWWRGSTVVGSSACLIPPGGSNWFSLGDSSPDGVQVVATAWPSGFVVQDFKDVDAVTLHYPTGRLER